MSIRSTWIETLDINVNCLI